MAAFDEETAFGPPRAKPAVHVIGENVDALSAPELEERIELCRAEIERLETAKAAREATRLAAHSFFKLTPANADCPNLAQSAGVHPLLRIYG